jgi:molybdate transport system substrate-binding protein
MKWKLLFITILVLVSTCAVVSRVQAAEIMVMTGGALADPLKELTPAFERMSHDKIVSLATGMGVGASYIPTRIRAGEVADVIILPDEALNELEKEGQITLGTRVPLANSRIGMAVRAGASKPDISSVEALKRTLLNAKSIAFSAQVSGQYLSTELFPRLGIADQLKSKMQRIERERVGAVVARGEAEIGFQQISELLPIPGIVYVGPLPAKLQRVTVFSAAVPTHAKNVIGGKRLIQFLSSRDAAPVLTKCGLDPALVQ